jgi:tetratricopeptide (TPR) repeat protein
MPGVYIRAVISTLNLPRAWLFLPLAVLCGFYVSISAVQHSEWHKERLLRRLLSGSRQEQLKAASALAHFGGEQQLISALKSESPQARDYAQAALEYFWFHREGRRAHQAVEAAFQAEQKKNFDTALKLLNRILEEHPRFAEAWNRRGSVYWQMGRYEESMADCQQAIFLNPNHYGAWQGVGVCHLQLGDVAEACRCLRAALKIIPYDETTRRCLDRCEELLRALPSPQQRTFSKDVI